MIDVKETDYYIENPKELASLYKNLFREAISFCSTCPKFRGQVEDARQRVINRIKMGVPKYRMKPGALISTHMFDVDGLPKAHYTCKNITDDIAEILIKLGYSDSFL